MRVATWLLKGMCLGFPTESKRSLDWESVDLSSLPPHDDWVCYMCCHMHSQTRKSQGDRLFVCGYPKRGKEETPRMPCLVSYTLRLCYETANVDAYVLMLTLPDWVEVIRHACIPIEETPKLFFESCVNSYNTCFMDPAVRDVFHRCAVCNLVYAWYFIQEMIPFDLMEFFKFMAFYAVKLPAFKFPRSGVAYLLEQCMDPEFKDRFAVRLSTSGYSHSDRDTTCTSDLTHMESMASPLYAVDRFPSPHVAVDLNKAITWKVIMLRNFCGPLRGSGVFGPHQVYVLNKLRKAVMRAIGGPTSRVASYVGFSLSHNHTDVLVSCFADLEPVHAALQDFWLQHCEGLNHCQFITISPGKDMNPFWKLYQSCKNPIP
jgi:hypothetical protein